MEDWSAGQTTSLCRFLFATLPVAFGIREAVRRQLLAGNQALKKAGMDWNRFMSAKKDLRFQLGHNNYRSAIALVFYLHTVRMSCDPDVKKDQNFVSDEPVLTAANAILDYVAESIITHHRLSVDEFWGAPHRGSKGRS